MPDICQALVIDAPPEAVFDAINSAAATPEWQPTSIVRTGSATPFFRVY